MIFVFDIKSENVQQELEDYCKAIELLAQYSRDAKLFVLLHKMDLIPKDQRERIFEERRAKVAQLSHPFKPQIFHTSIWHNTLYKVRRFIFCLCVLIDLLIESNPSKAWSSIVYSLIPNAPLLQGLLDQFCSTCEAEEVVLFEKATFLDIAHSSNPVSRFAYKDAHRFEKISNIIKMFKLSCACVKSYNSR